MFRTALIDLNNGRSLRIFIGTASGSAEDTDGFAITADLAASLGLQTSTIRGEISKHELGSLEAIPKLKEWLVENDQIPAGTGKINFAASALWLECVRRHVDKQTFAAVKEAYQKALNSENLVESIESSSGEPTPRLLTNALERVEEIDEEVDEGVHGEEEVAGDIVDVEEVEEVKDPIIHSLSEKNKGERFIDALYGEEEREDDEAKQKEMMNQDDDGEYILLSYSPSNQEEEEDSSEEEGKKSESSSEPSSDSSSSGEAFAKDLPKGVSQAVLTVPEIPDQFSASDFTKSHALKDYNVGRSLKKQLKKMRSWWIKPYNAERKSKAISETTAQKREERLLCFLGFIHRYKAVPDDFDLTVGLVLNHRLVDAFCNYMKEVRQSSDGNMSENMTALISACRWLYRKEKTVKEPQMIRRLKDYRNSYQSKAVRTRKGEDIEELTERGKWLSWQEFVAVIQKLRNEWETHLSKEPASISNARKLHDLLLLGLYSCTPARGSEIRLLQFLSEEELSERKGRLTIKKYVEANKVNIITKIGDIWRMYVSDFKNSRSFGADATDLDVFDWWCHLFETYLESYRPLLVGAACDHSFVFVTKTAKPFSGSYYSDYISTLLFKLTGVAAATNLLRSSFVTSFYDSDAANDPKMRESVAQVMRHSSKEAQKTYDRRTTTQRKRQGLDLIAKMSSTTPISSAKKPLTAKKRLTFSSERLEEDHHAEFEETPDFRQDQRLTKNRKIDAAVGVERSSEVVVEFQHLPHVVIRTEGSKYVLAPMERSSQTNAPVYFVSPTAHFFSAETAKCKKMMKGQWVDREFTLTK
jgi:hypothetical protein